MLDQYHPSSSQSYTGDTHLSFTALNPLPSQQLSLSLFSHDGGGCVQPMYLSSNSRAGETSPMRQSQRKQTKGSVAQLSMLAKMNLLVGIPVLGWLCALAFNSKTG